MKFSSGSLEQLSFIRVITESHPAHGSCALECGRQDHALPELSSGRDGQV